MIRDKHVTDILRDFSTLANNLQDSPCTTHDTMTFGVKKDDYRFPINSESSPTSSPICERRNLIPWAILQI